MGDKTDGTEMKTLKQGSTDAASVQAYYDDWAASYDDELSSWDYRAPADAAEGLAKHLKHGAEVLDVGCGTGLFAVALGRHLECVYDGLDISQPSLDLAAKRGIYRTLTRHNLQQVPLPAARDSADAVASVGVMTYIEDHEGLFRDLCRIVRPGGAIAFTHRADLWDQQDFQQVLDRVTAAGLWQAPRVSEPRPYIPDHEDFENIFIRHVLAVVV